RLRLRPLSASQGTAASAGRHHVGRRTADVRHRPHADERAQARAARRAVDGPGSGDRGAGVRPRSPHPLGGLHRADRRAERQPGAQGGGPRLPARGRPHQGRGPRRRARRQRRHPQGIHGVVSVIPASVASPRAGSQGKEWSPSHALDPGHFASRNSGTTTEENRMDCQLDIFFLEALINGLLLAGLLALLALGLNLIFGVIDVVWICYAEIVMVGMYGINYAYKGGAPFLVAALLGIFITALAGIVLHYLVIRPVLETPPINQLLVTGGVLFFLQAAATMAFGIEFKNLGIRLGSLSVADMSFSWARILTFLVALGGMLGLWLFLKRTYLGTAIRAIAQDRQIMPLMGVDSRRLYLVTSAIGGGLAGLAATLMVLQYDIYPQIGLQFGPLIFMICVLGGLGNMIGGFIAAFIISQFIAVGSSCFHTEWGYAVAFLFFMVAIFIRPQGLFGGKS